MPPSKEHKELVALARTYLAARATGRGIIYVPEVPLADGYVVDAAGFCALQDQYNRRDIRRDRASNLGAEVYPDAVVVEAKASRSDFLATFSESRRRHANRRTPIAHLHYVAAPRNIIKPGELPDFWGHIALAGGGMSLVVKPLQCAMELEKYNAFCANLIWPLFRQNQRELDDQAQQFREFFNNPMRKRETP